jgi:hypothetical protein
LQIPAATVAKLALIGLLLEYWYFDMKKNYNRWEAPFGVPEFSYICEPTGTEKALCRMYYPTNCEAFEL